MNARLALCLSVFAVSPLFAEDPVVWFDGPGVTLFNGDTNGDFERDVSDAVYLLSHLYLGGPEPAQLAGCEAAPAIQNGDSNGDGELDLSDGVHMLSWLYFGGPEPVYPCAEGFGAGATVIQDAGPIPVTPPPAVNICNGDLIFLTGEGTQVTQTLIRPDGSTKSLMVIRWHAISGTGVPSGMEYIGVGGVTLTFNSGPGASTTTTNPTMRFITPGSEGNHHAVAQLHITRNANGEITAEVNKISFECRADN
jgi:hypothetical protein